MTKDIEKTSNQNFSYKIIRNKKKIKVIKKCNKNHSDNRVNKDKLDNLNSIANKSGKKTGKKGRLNEKMRLGIKIGDFLLFNR